MSVGSLRSARLPFTAPPSRKAATPKNVTNENFKSLEELKKFGKTVALNKDGSFSVSVNAKPGQLVRVAGLNPNSPFTALYGRGDRATVQVFVKSGKTVGSDSVTFEAYKAVGSGKAIESVKIKLTVAR